MLSNFSGVPWIESPSFRADDPDRGLTSKEKSVAIDLSTRGFAVLDFPDPDILARVDRIKASLSPQLGVDPVTGSYDAASVQRRLQDAWKFNDDVRQIACNESILRLLERLYGRAPFPFQTLNFPVGTQQSVHSDSVHFSTLPERFMCGVWLAMEDVHADAGPLFYVPGSHRWPIISNLMIGRKGFGSTLSSAQDPFGPAWQDLCRAYGGEEDRFLARKGQALIWCANLLHGGAPQIDHRLTRWSQVTHYFFDDCIYYTPAFSDEALGKLDVRLPTDIVNGTVRYSAFLGHPLERTSGEKRRSMWKHGRQLWHSLIKS